MGQLVQCYLCKPEDPSLYSLYSREKLKDIKAKAMTCACVCYPAVRLIDRWILQLTSSLVESVVSRFSKRPGLKKKERRKGEKEGGKQASKG